MTTPRHGTSPDLYETIGTTYASTRVEDPRIAAPIHAALGDASTVVNVGAGSGNYEPRDRQVVAVEPSPAMIAQRATTAAPVVRATAERLPFAARTFDVAMATLTVHHWVEPDRGLSEMQRVARRQVVFYFERTVTSEFWMLDFFPEGRTAPTELTAPGEDHLRSALDVQHIETVLVPSDCTDGFGCAYWARPEAYLEPRVQAGMSWLAILPDDVRRAGAQRLRAALRSGEWDRRYGHLRSADTFDGGYRIAIAGS